MNKRIRFFFSTEPVIDTKSGVELLSPNDNVPLVIGFEKLLSEFNVFFNYHTQDAFIKVAK